MATTRRKIGESQSPKRRPATTPEERENQVIAAAYDLAEKQIRDGTASSQVISHFLKRGSTREKVEEERIGEEVKLLKIKAEAIESQARVEELYKEALHAMRTYQGRPREELDD